MIEDYVKNAAEFHRIMGRIAALTRGQQFHVLMGLAWISINSNQLHLIDKVVDATVCNFSDHQTHQRRDDHEGNLGPHSEQSPGQVIPLYDWMMLQRNKKMSYSDYIIDLIREPTETEIKDGKER